ncbi:MAG: hypothetical protein ABSC01_11775, partial [Verrucomicrobiota bacterium]
VGIAVNGIFVMWWFGWNRERAQSSTQETALVVTNKVESSSIWISSFGNLHYDGGCKIYLRDKSRWFSVS